MKRVKRIFMTGEAGYHNLGDEGMALASARRLKLYFPSAALVATGLDPLGAVLRHQAQIVPWPLTPHEIRSGFLSRLTRKYARKFGAPEDFLDPVAASFEEHFQRQYRTNVRFRSVVAEIEQADLVFDMGHGALNDVFSPFMVCFVYFIAGKLGKPLFISGQSVGPLWRQSSIRMLQTTLPMAHTVGLRDVGVSRDILTSQVGLTESQVRMVEVGDDTLDLEPMEPDWEAIPPRLRDIIRSGEFIAVQWRGTDYSQQLHETQQLVPFIELIETLHQVTKLPVVFVPLSWELSGDVLMAARIKDYLGAQIPFHVLWNYLGAPETKYILGLARFGVGLSYHFHVFSLAQGVPTLALYTNPYYEIKLKGACAAFGYKAAPLAHPSDLENKAQLVARLEEVMNMPSAARKRLMETAQTTRNVWHQTWQRFLADEQLEAELPPSFSSPMS